MRRLFAASIAAVLFGGLIAAQSDANGPRTAGEHHSDSSAGAAQAPEPFHVEFNRGELRIGSNEPIKPLLSGEDPAVFDGEVDPATGKLTVPVEGLELSPLIGALPGLPCCEILIASAVQEPLHGSFDEATGRLELPLRVDLGVFGFCGFGGCTPLCRYEDVRLDLSTANAFAGLRGARFEDGLDRAGAIVASWEGLGLPAGAYPEFCDQLVDSPGALLLGLDPAELNLSVRPKTKTVTQGKEATFTATVRNLSNVDGARFVRVCVRAPEGALRRWPCTLPRHVAPGEIARLRFDVEARLHGEPRSYRLRFTARAVGDFDRAHDRAKLKVLEN
jgi:hypothetical protein